MTYGLGVDLGTTFTAAALARDGRSEIVALGDHMAQVPSVVFLHEDGSVLIGDAAVRRAIREPTRVAREFKRRFGDQRAQLLGGTPQSAEALTARLLRWTVDTVAAREGTRPSTLVVTHPANWGKFRRELLMGVIARADVGAAQICSEPEAAAMHFASTERVAVGEIVAVYDLGGGTFDAAVLRKTAAGFDIEGPPAGIEHLGGLDFDAAVLDHVLRSLGGNLGAEIRSGEIDDPEMIDSVTRLRAECVAAKEALSADTEAEVRVSLPGHQQTVRITRSELESYLREPLMETVSCMKRAISAANITAEDLSAVVLVGGSSRIPLIAELLTVELGRPIVLSPQAKLGVAIGAALWSVPAPVAPPIVKPAPPEASPTGSVTGAVAHPAVKPVAAAAPRPKPRTVPAGATPVAPRATATGPGPVLPKLGNLSLPEVPALVAAGWRYVLCLILAGLALVMAFSGPIDYAPAAPSGSDQLHLDENPLANGRIEVNPSKWFQITASEPGVSLTKATLTLRLSAARVVPKANVVSDQKVIFNLHNLRLLLGGPVHAQLAGVQGGSTTPSKLDFVLVPGKTHWYATIPGVGWVLSILFAAGYAESILRPIRRHARVRFADRLGMAALGALAGASLVVGSWVLFKHLPTPTAAFTVIISAACACALIPALIANGKTKSKTRPANRRAAQ